MRTKMPNWNCDPFYYLSSAERKRYKRLERESDEKLREAHPNGTFALKVPRRIPGRMVEPESMTIRRKGRVYMDPKPSMEPPKIFRGRGRTMRLERERKELVQMII